MWNLKKGKILVFTNVCKKCGICFKSPKNQYKVCHECMAVNSPTRYISKAYNDIADDRELLLSRIVELETQIKELQLQ